MGLPSQQQGWGHLSYPHFPLVCLLASGILLFAVPGDTGRGGDVVKRIVPFQGTKSQLGFVRTQLVTNNLDGTTSLGLKGSQVGWKEGSETLLHLSLGAHGASEIA